MTDKDFRPLITTEPPPKVTLSPDAQARVIALQLAKDLLNGITLAAREEKIIEFATWILTGDTEVTAINHDGPPFVATEFPE